MLITELKNKELLKTQLKGKTFLLLCHGCKELRFPEKEAEELVKELTAEGIAIGDLTTDYICNEEILKQRLSRFEAQLEAAETILVLSCGVGVQTVAALHIMDTYWSLILPYAAINLAFSCMVYYGFFKGIPKEMEEAACIDGASIWQTFYLIIMPLVGPATMSITIYVFLSAWNEFLLANVLVGTTAHLKTLPLGVLFFQGQFTTDWGSMGATMVIASLPAIIVYCLFSEQVEGAMTTSGAVKG